MKIIITLFILTFLSACNQSSSNKKVSVKEITRNIQQDIISLIPTGEIITNVMDSIIMTPRRQILNEKFLQAQKENPEWFIQQLELQKNTGHKFSYDPNLGLTEEEWKEYEKLNLDLSDMKAISTGTAKIIVTRKNNTISFKADGKLSYLNSTTIDIKNNVVKVSNYTLTPMDTICIKDSNNIYKTAWRGYKWKFSDPENLTFPTSIEEMNNYAAKRFEFTLGLFENTRETFVEISGYEKTEGEQKISYRIPIVF